MSNIIQASLQKVANNQYENMQRGSEFIKRVFDENVQNANQYVYGVAQTETKSKGASSVAAGAMGYNMYDWSDHIIAIDSNNSSLVIISLDGETIVNKETYKNGEFTIKAMSKGIQETIYSITPNILKKIMRMRQPDIYKRTKYTITSNGVSTTYLVGEYGPGEWTNYQNYDNNSLFQTLKDFVKNNK